MNVKELRQALQAEGGDKESLVKALVDVELPNAIKAQQEKVATFMAQVNEWVARMCKQKQRDCGEVGALMLDAEITEALSAAAAPSDFTKISSGMQPLLEITSNIQLAIVNSIVYPYETGTDFYKKDMAPNKKLKHIAVLCKKDEMHTITMKLPVRVVVLFWEPFHYLILYKTLR